MQHFHMIYGYIVTTYKLSEHKNKRENEEKAFLYLCYKNNDEKKAPKSGGGGGTNENNEKKTLIHMNIMGKNLYAIKQQHRDFFIYLTFMMEKKRPIKDRILKSFH